uniref:uncharacterized protein LOC125907573 n=1 Tax=Anopheles coluzzii TaxID=1518534 RepID=UPI0020FFA91A|nr:uncharacterized protein LOC125907573 [Anopheles coluzzii]
MEVKGAKLQTTESSEERNFLAKAELKTFAEETTLSKMNEEALPNAPRRELLKEADLLAQVSSGKGKSSRHGDSYQLGMGLVVTLRAFRMHQLDRTFKFVIVMEDPAGKDFDDIMYHYSSDRLSSGTVSIQAKHKQSNDDDGKQGVLTEDLLHARWDSKPKPSFSIAKYFISFLEVDQNLGTTTRSYVLCTNYVLHKSLKGQFIKREQQSDEDMLQFCYDVGATCYQINPEHENKTLEDQLINSALAKLGKLMANDVFHRKEIICKDSLYYTFAGFINKCVDRCDANATGFKFNEVYFNAAPNTHIGIFRTEFAKECQRLMKDGKLKIREILKTAIIRFDQSSLTAALSKEESLEQLISKFYQSFMLVCQTPHEEELMSKAKDLLPKWCSAELVLDKLHTLLFNAMKSATPDPISLTFLQEKFREVDPNVNFTLLKCRSKEYLDSMQQKYPFIQIDPERLKRSKLNSFIASENSGGIYEFKCSLNLDVSSLIVGQTLLLHRYETLFIDSAMHQDKKELLNILDDLMSYLKDVNHPTIKLITFWGKLEAENLCEIKKLCERYHQKVVIVEQILDSVEHFSMDELIGEAKEQLFHDHENQIIFGTVTPLTSIIHEKDDLSFLLNVLEILNQPEKMARYDSIEHNYEQIKPWYIHRQFVPLDSPPEEENITRNGNVTYSANSFGQQAEVHFAEMVHYLHDYDKDTMSDVKKTLALSEETQDPPGCRDDENDGKVYIFLNDAGAGKTTYFTWLAWRLSTYDRSLYVIKLIALEYSTDFERLEECGVDHWNDTQIVRLLYRFIHLALFVPSVCRRTIEETDVHRAEADRCAELISLSNGRIVLDETKTKDLTAMQLIELRLFREKFNQNQLVLILDGFDEIAPYYKDVVMKCFARFAQLDGLRNLYISSRPYGFVEAFKNAFSNCNICKLKPFTEEDQIYLLHLFLRSKIAAYSDCRFDELIPVVGILYATVNFQEGTIQNVPLMFYILYVTFLPKVQRYVDFDAQQICGKIFIEKGLPLLDMVETYVDLKLRIHNVEKAGLTDSASVTAGAKEIEQLLARDVKAEHGLLGAYVMFPKSCWNELFTKQQLKKVALYVHNLTQGEDSGGLIDRIQDGMPSFVHRSFAEFFAAYWLSQHYRRVLGSVSFFRSVTFWNDDSYQEIHTFFEAMVDRQCSDYPVHNVIKKRSTSSVEEIISQDPSAIYKRDGVGRTPFHLLARYYSNELVELLMKRNILVRETVSLKDELLQWSVLDYAFVCNNTTYIEQLLTLGPDVNLDVLLQQLLTSDIDLLLKRSHTLVNLLEKHDATRALTRQIHTRVVQHILRDRQLNLNARLEKLKSLTVLEYCTELGAYDMFLEFVAQSDDPYRVLATDINGLFQKAFLCRDTRFVFYYIEQHNFPLPWVDNFAGFSSVLVSVCGSYKMSTFKVLFKQLCLQRKIRCINESAILHEELPDAPGDEQFNRRIENMRCCVRSVRDIHNDLPIYQEGIPFQDECIVECLLARTIDMGSIEKTGYVLQMTETVVTNELIEKIMRLLPKGVSHKESIGTFKYLLQHATNLYQTDSEGRNLLHMIAQHGCFFMLHCLVEKGVDVSLINAKNGWNVFHYIASRANNAHSLHFETDSRNIIFKYMLQAVPDPDYLTARDIAGYSVLDVAIVKQNFSVARTIVNSQISHVVGGAEERLQALFDKVKHVLTEEHEMKVTKFFWYLHEYTEEHDEWSEVYATAAKWKYSKPDYTSS